MAKNSRVVNLCTGRGLDEYVKSTGADVEENAKGRFTSVSTEKGKMFYDPSVDTYDKPTQSNLKRWLKVLGLLTVLGLLIDYFWGILGLPYVASF